MDNSFELLLHNSIKLSTYPEICKKEDKAGETPAAIFNLSQAAEYVNFFKSP